MFESKIEKCHAVKKNYELSLMFFLCQYGRYGTASTEKSSDQR